MKELLIGLALVATAFTANGFDHKGELVEDTYMVVQGDTLWSISAKYIEKNTHGPRDIREFISGIVELNYDRVFKGRKPSMIYPGDELRINYWTAVNKDGDEADTE